MTSRPAWLMYKVSCQTLRTGPEMAKWPHKKTQSRCPGLVTWPPSGLLDTTRNTTDFRGQGTATHEVTLAPAQSWGTRAPICKLLVVFIKIKKLGLHPREEGVGLHGGAPSPAASQGQRGLLPHGPLQPSGLCPGKEGQVFGESLSGEQAQSWPLSSTQQHGLGCPCHSWGHRR